MSSRQFLSLCPLCWRVSRSIGWRSIWKRNRHTVARVCNAEKVVVVHKTSRLEFERMKHSDKSEKEIARMVRSDVCSLAFFLTFMTWSHHPLLVYSTDSRNRAYFSSFFSSTASRGRGRLWVPERETEDPQGEPGRDPDLPQVRTEESTNT